MIRTWQPLALIAGLGGLACGTPKPPEEAAPGITAAAPEECLSGSTCPNGNRCAAGDGEAAGECPLQIKPPTCGGATCNTGEVCCWAREEGRPRCAASCDADADAVFACTGPEQCPELPPGVKECDYQ